MRGVISRDLLSMVPRTISGATAGWLTTLLLVLTCFGCGDDTDKGGGANCEPSGVSPRSGRWEGTVAIVSQTPSMCGPEIDMPVALIGCDGSQPGVGGFINASELGCDCSVSGSAISFECQSELDLFTCRLKTTNEGSIDFTSETTATEHLTLTNQFSGSDCPGECTMELLVTWQWVESGCDMSAPSVIQGNLHVPVARYR